MSAGPKELCGAVDLISQYKLLQHHEFFCKKSLTVSLSDSHYLHNVVGDTEIRKGEGMQLDQLVQNMSQSRETNSTRIQPFDMDELMEAFQLSDTTPVELPLVRFFSQVLWRCLTEVLEHEHVLFFFLSFRKRRELLQFHPSQKVSRRIRTGSIRNTRTGVRTKIESIRSTNTGIETEVRIKTRTETGKRRKMDTTIRVNTLRNTMIR